MINYGKIRMAFNVELLEVIAINNRWSQAW